MEQLLDLILHSDDVLLKIVQDYGVWVYAILFLIIFAETGLVVTPFLPGDSLLFAAGAIAATGKLNPLLVFVLLTTAAFTGNTVNYAIGRSIGPRVFKATQQQDGLIAKLLNREYLQRGHAFFEQYGGKAVILSRFVPIARTFVPFVAGASQMTWASYMFFTAIGAVGWVGLCLGAGLLFGNVPIVQENFSLVALGIVGISLVPMLIEYLRHGRRTKTV